MEQKQIKRMTEEDIIRELIELLNQNQQKEAVNRVFEMAALIDRMEAKFNQVTEELVNVRRQLERMEQERSNKSLRVVLKKAVDKLGQQYRKMKEQLFEIKQEVKAKAAGIVAKMKSKGKAAVGRMVEFLGIKEKLQKIGQKARESIAEVDKTLEKIDAFGTGMREAGQKIANIFRVVAGKPEKKYGEKKFSKTELVKKSFLIKRKLLIGIEDLAYELIKKVEKISSTVKSEYQYGAVVFEKKKPDEINLVVGENDTRVFAADKRSI